MLVGTEDVAGQLQVYLSANQGYILPAGTPREIVDLLAGSIKRAMETDEMQKKLTDLGFESRYLGPAELAAFWEDVDSLVGPLIDLAKRP